MDACLHEHRYRLWLHAQAKKDVCLHLTVRGQLWEAEGRAMQTTVYGPGIDDVQQAKPKTAAKRELPLSELQVRAQATDRGFCKERAFKAESRQLCP